MVEVTVREEAGDVSPGSPLPSSSSLGRHTALLVLRHWEESLRRDLVMVQRLRAELEGEEESAGEEPLLAFMGLDGEGVTREPVLQPEDPGSVQPEGEETEAPSAVATSDPGGAEVPSDSPEVEMAEEPSASPEVDWAEVPSVSGEVEWTVYLLEP